MRRAALAAGLAGASVLSATLLVGHRVDGPRGAAVGALLGLACALSWAAGRLSAPAGEAGREALLEEAAWLERAHEASAGRRYSAEQRQGFGWAAGWVRSHAERGQTWR